MQAKRREGVLSHFPSHVGTHFRCDLAASSFAGPFLFDDEVLTRVIGASREDSNLDAQLSIAKAFKFPIFQGLGNSDWKVSSGQRSGASSSSSSASRGKRSEDSEKKGDMRKAFLVLLVLVVLNLRKVALLQAKGRRIFGSSNHIPVRQ